MAEALCGVATRFISTDRLQVHYREAGSGSGTPVVLVHGNVSSSAFWDDLMLALPPGQTRHVLDRYAANGGRYTEVIVPNAGHSPHIERQQDVVERLKVHWAAAEPR
ncbi:MAG: alpha/beta fold hydrolase [Bacillota bacterium]